MRKEAPPILKPEGEENDPDGSNLADVIDQSLAEEKLIEEESHAFEKISYSIKDLIDISSDLKGKAEEMKKTLRELNERVRQFREEHHGKKLDRKKLEQLIGIEFERNMQELEIGRIIAMAGIFKHKAEGHMERMLSDYESCKDKPSYKADIMPKIMGKYYKTLYKIYGTNMQFHMPTKRGNYLNAPSRAILP